MTTGHIDRDKVEEAKRELVDRRAAAQQRKITTILAEIEVDLAQAVLDNPDSPVLVIVGKLLGSGSTEEALMALVESIGEEGFMNLMRRISSQQQPVQQPVQQAQPLQPAQHQPAGLPSGQSPVQPNAIVIPEVIEVYDADGRPEHWSIRRDDRDAEPRANARGYYRTVRDGAMIYQKRRDAAGTPAYDTAVQPAAGGSWFGSWLRGSGSPQH